MSTPSTAANYAEVGQQVIERLAPAKLSAFRKNAEEVAAYMHRHELNGLSVDDWMTAVWALHEKELLLWDIKPIPAVEPSPRQKGIERAKKLEAKMRKDYLDSLKDRSVEQLEKTNAESAQDAKALAEAKELKDLKSKIYNKISNYFKGHHSGGRDYSSTESGQAKLRTVLASKVGGQQSDGLDKLLTRVTSVQLAKEALKAVDDASYKLP